MGAVTRPPGSDDAARDSAARDDAASDAVRGFERAVAAQVLRRESLRTAPGAAAGAALPALPAALTGALLVEGASDRAAVHAAAGLLGADPAAAGVAVLPMGGAMSVRRFVGLLMPAGVRLHGLCDEGEAGFFERAGLGDDAVSVCRPDLEGELIQALGTQRVEAVLARRGDLGLFRTFQRQPAQRERDVAAQLHRFFGTTSGRKELYGRLLTSELSADELPRPLRDALTAVLGDRSASGRDHTP
jgi:hypothetical protein